MAEALVLSIHHRFAELIYQGVKCFELRKVAPRKRVSRVYLYETKPVGRVTGEFLLAGVISGDPECVWEQVKDATGLSREEYMRYYEGNKRAYAFEVSNPKRFDIGMSLEDLQITRPPQSFRYVTDRAV